MRILTVGNMYPPHHLGGYELMWRSAVAHHRAAGNEVRVLTTDWRESYVDASTPADGDVHRELRWYWHDHEFPVRAVFPDTTYRWSSWWSRRGVPPVSWTACD